MIGTLRKLCLILVSSAEAPTGSDTCCSVVMPIVGNAMSAVFVRLVGAPLALRAGLRQSGVILYSRFTARSRALTLVAQAVKSQFICAELTFSY